MRLYRCHSLSPLALILVLLLTACGGGGGGSGSNSTTSIPASLTRIDITPTQPSLAKGTALSLAATGIYSDNTTRALNGEVSWLSSDDSIATIDNSGKITAVIAGPVTIEASLGGVAGNTQLTVTDAVLSRLELSPGSAQIAKGTRLPLTLIGHYSDGSTQEVAEQASWTVSDSGVASLSDPITSGDLWLSGFSVGSTTLDASLGPVNAQIVLDVTAAELIQLVISPQDPVLPLGATLDLSARGLYSDGSSQVLTQQVDWGSADSSKVLINAAGRAQPQAIGSTTVRATLAGISGYQTLTVSAAVLESIEVSAASGSLPLAHSQPLLALGHYSDNRLQDITEQVVWASSAPESIAISNASGSRGLATALAIGDVTITASLGAVSGTLDQRVTAATLDSIEVSPRNAYLAVGTRQEFRATGRYSDDSVQDITGAVSWVSADAGVALASNVVGEQGHTLALAAGNTTVSASLDGISGEASLVVSPAQLLSITVLPAELSLPVGVQQTLRAEGNFSDGSVQGLDGQVSWESERPSTAAIDAGTLSALQSGSARIIARLGEVAGYSLITVNTATLASLRISPANSILAIGTQTQLQAFVLDSDGNEWDVTQQVSWGTADSTQLRVDNSTGQQGQLTALDNGGSGGDVVVTASLYGLQAQSTISISTATLSGLRITAASASLDSAEAQQLIAWADFDDATSQALGTQVIWESDRPDLATVSNQAADRGWVVAGIGVSGSAVINARFGGLSAELPLTINNTPQRPVSLVVLATPNALYNDGIDASSIEVRVRAADPGASVADNTVVTLQVSQAGIPLASQPLVTTGGSASTSLTATETGLLHIKASIDPGPSDTTTLYSTADLFEVIAGAAFDDAPAGSGDELPSGTRFGFFMLNLSNRDFPLHEFRLFNDGGVLFTAHTPAELNGNKLSGGLKMGIIYTLTTDITANNMEGRYYLSDPATGGASTLRFIRP